MCHIYIPNDHDNMCFNRLKAHIVIDCRICSLIYIHRSTTLNTCICITLIQVSVWKNKNNNDNNLDIEGTAGGLGSV